MGQQRSSMARQILIHCIKNIVLKFKQALMAVLSLLAMDPEAKGYMIG
jgi:hypothetical protein